MEENSSSIVVNNQAEDCLQKTENPATMVAVVEVQAVVPTTVYLVEVVRNV